MYLYSNIIGTFVFNQNFQIREKVIFTEKDILSNNEQLSKNEPTDAEKVFMDRFKNIKNLRLEPDEKSIEKVNQVLIGYNEQYHSKNLLLTKLQVRASVSNDLLIIQASSSVQELSKSINLLSKRLREWYSYLLPEVENMIEDNLHFADRISKDEYDRLVRDFNVDITMGSKLSKDDREAIISLANAILQLDKQKQLKERYLETLMKENCPNITEVAGYLTGAKLLTLAGSLRNMVLMPASTIQLLGAEKALFRHMVTKSRSPKHGIIIEHPLLQRVGREDKGKAARALADKILLAAKVDFFKGQFIGERLRKEVEAKFK
jgi:nucleolar protein 56